MLKHVDLCSQIGRYFALGFGWVKGAMAISPCLKLAFCDIGPLKLVTQRYCAYLPNWCADGKIALT